MLGLLLLPTDTRYLGIPTQPRGIVRRSGPTEAPHKIKKEEITNIDGSDTLNSKTPYFLIYTVTGSLCVSLSLLNGAETGWTPRGGKAWETSVVNMKRRR